MAVDRSVGEAVTRLATAQQAAIRWDQLLQAGYSPRRVRSQLNRGQLYRLHWRVYSVVDPALHPLVAESGALLALGENAALSHRSAAAMWGILSRDDDLVDVTVTGNPRAKVGVRIHRIAAFSPLELRTRAGLRLTSPARTVCDLAATEPRREVEQAMEEAIAARLSTESEIRAVLERHGSRPGSCMLRMILAAQQGPGFTRSAAERALLELIIAAGLPAPEKNVRVGKHRVDFLWPDERVVVEVDGYQFHGHRMAFEADRKRDRMLRAAGYTVLRITWRALQAEPYAVVADLTRALTLPGSPGRGAA